MLRNLIARYFPEKIIDEIHCVVRQYFGSHIEIKIEPDFDYPKKRVISILTPYDVDETINRLDEFDDEWWLPNRRRFEHYISVVTVEFV